MKDNLLAGIHFLTNLTAYVYMIVLMFNIYCNQLPMVLTFCLNDTQKRSARVMPRLRQDSDKQTQMADDFP